MKLDIWAVKWGIPQRAIDDLRKTLGMAQLTVVHDVNKSEASVLNLVRLEASRKDCRLWRNNVGAFQNEQGQWVRYGLGNESEKMNSFIKSSDLIGIKPVKIRETMIGMTIGQFVSREIKESIWTYKGTEREQAQLRWIELITSLGGDACFANNEGTL